MRNINDIFLDRTIYKFKDKSVDLKILHQIYDVMKLGPTSRNSLPLRIIFVHSLEAKQRLENCVMEGNISKVKSAPLVALFAYDTEFYKLMDKTNPVSPEMKNYFSSSEIVALDSAIRNSTLQAAYFSMIARGYGLDCGPMSGFDPKKIEQEFLSGTNYKINYICNLGYRDGENPYPRLPRLDFDEVCTLV